MKTLLMLFFLVSCAIQAPQPDAQPEEGPQIEYPSPSDRINDVGTKVELELSKFKPDQAQRLEAIKAKVQDIINSPEFKEAVIGYYTSGKRKFNETSKTNEEVYSDLTSKQWDVKIELAWGKRNVLGWTNPSTLWIWFNSRYFDGRENSGLAGTFCHEMAHKFGFGHAFRNYKGREYTVPYGVGTICAQLYK